MQFKAVCCNKELACRTRIELKNVFTTVCLGHREEREGDAEGRGGRRRGGGQRDGGVKWRWSGDGEAAVGAGAGEEPVSAGK